MNMFMVKNTAKKNNFASNTLVTIYVYKCNTNILDFKTMQ